MTAAEYNRKLPLPGVYAAAWRTLKAMSPHQMVTVPGWIVSMGGWGKQRVTAGEALAHVRRAADARIYARAGQLPPEARDDIELRRDRNAHDDRVYRRVRLYQWNSKRVAARLGHMLDDPREI